jgi:hypothetical protein
MAQPPATQNLADTVPPVEDAAVSSNSSSDSLASDAIQTGSSQSSAEVDTQDPTSSPSNDSQEAACKTAEGKDPTGATVLPTDLESKDMLIPELEPDPESGNESDGAMAIGLERKYRYTKYSWYNNDLEGRKAKATRLAIQSNLHTQLVEDRLKQLEKDVRAILKLPPPKNIDDDEGQISENVMQPLPHHQAVERLTWAAWSAPVPIPKMMLTRKKWIHGLEIDDIRKNVVEILIEEPQLIVRSFNNWASRNEPAPVIDPSLWVPWRVRFRSPLMLKLLERITEQNVTIGPHKHQLVLLRPFKLLVAYADKIFSFLQELEDKDAAGLLIAGE